MDPIELLKQFKIISRPGIRELAMLCANLPIAIVRADPMLYCDLAQCLIESISHRPLVTANMLQSLIAMKAADLTGI